MRLFIVTLALVAGLASPALAAPKSCDRGCLEGLLGKYLAALPGHDPAKAPMAKGARFVENDQALKPGEGTWTTVEALGGYRHVFTDPETGQVAAITTVTEKGKGAILDVRLKVVDRKIVEAESQIIRDAGGAARYEALKTPESMWLQAVPAADRLDRAGLIAAASKYFDGMQRNDPKGDYSFFDPDCNRLEHATQTTNLKKPEAYGHSTDTDFSSMTCQAQFQTGFLGFVTAIRDRRFVVDVERQVVFAFVVLDHNGTVRVLHMSTGKDFVVPAYFDVPRTLQVGEGFKVRAGRLWRIEMTLTELPYGMRPAFDVAPELARAKPVNKPPCARDCLYGLIDGVLQAMVDHAPDRAPLAPGARYTENGQVLKPGDGLWGTATAIAMRDDGLSSLGPNSSAFKLYAADEAAGEGVYLGAVNENGTPGMLLLRVRASGGKAAEVEAVIVREETLGPRGGTITLFRGPVLSEFTPRGYSQPDPALLATAADSASRSALANAVKRYFDTVPAGDGDPQISPASPRRLNGRDAPLPPAGVRAFRVAAVDEERGLVLAIAVLDRGGRAPGGEVGSSNLYAGLFKVEGGKLTHEEAIERPVPFGMTTGWSQ